MGIVIILFLKNQFGYAACVDSDAQQTYLGLGLFLTASTSLIFIFISIVSSCNTAEISLNIIFIHSRKHRVEWEVIAGLKK